tara:strand:- start:3366 stop:3884 length:519 start_codon:yes stop_codon:yes gene_type:complete
VSIFPIDIIQLVEEEDVLYKKESYKDDSILLTKDMLFVIKKGLFGSKKLQKIRLDDIYSFEKISGGQESRIVSGLKISLIGVLLGAVTIFIPIFSQWVQNLLFFMGIISFVIGLHFILQSITRIKPHTSIYIEYNKGKTHIAVVFPDIGNTDAENLFNKMIVARNINKNKKI